MKKLVIIGGGFAGFWGAMSAVRRAQELNNTEKLLITLISKEQFHTIRPRLYQEQLDKTQLALNTYCDATGIKLSEQIL